MSEFFLSRAPSLFAKCAIKGLDFKNRIVKAAYYIHKCDHGAPSNLFKEYYEARADAGLLITEGCAVSKEAHFDRSTGGLYSARQVEAWKRVTDAIHEKDGKIFAQLTHAGRVAFNLPKGIALAPSPIAIRTPQLNKNHQWAIPKEMNKDDIKRVVEDFTKAARNAWSAGFDGVEIQAGYGNLVDTFLRTSTNKRLDAFGGSAENRCKFPIDVLQAVMSVYGNRCGMKLTPADNQNDISDGDPLGTYTYLLKRMSFLGVGYVELVESGTAANNKLLNGVVSNLKSKFSGRVISNGGYNLEKANLAVATGSADMVSFGRLFHDHPNLVQMFKEQTDPAVLRNLEAVEGEDDSYSSLSYSSIGI